MINDLEEENSSVDRDVKLGNKIYQIDSVFLMKLISTGKVTLLMTTLGLTSKDNFSLNRYFIGTLLIFLDLFLQHQCTLARLLGAYPSF